MPSLAWRNASAQEHPLAGHTQMLAGVALSTAVQGVYFSSPDRWRTAPSVRHPPMPCAHATPVGIRQSRQAARSADGFAVCGFRATPASYFAIASDDRLTSCFVLTEHVRVSCYPQLQRRAGPLTSLFSFVFCAICRQRHVVLPAKKDRTRPTLVVSLRLVLQLERVPCLPQ